MPSIEELVAEKNKQRALMKKEFFKLATHPEQAGQGYLFDPAMMRYQAMRATRIDHFRETPKNFLSLFTFVLAPLAASIYFVKKHRNDVENRIRNGEIAYKDRDFKLA